MLSAYITLVLVIIHYLIDSHQRHNLVDQAFVDFAVPQVLVIRNSKTAEKWTKAFEAAVLFFGDTQVITSVAILVSGYVQLPCGLSAYHWETIVDLAWFSALTHLTTLSSLRQYFRRRPTMAVLRAIFMGMTLILLAAALQPTVYVPQSRNGESAFTKSDVEFGSSQAAIDNFVSSPAVCLFTQKSRNEVWSSQSDRYPDESHPSMPYNPIMVILSLLYLASSYVTRVIRLFAPLAGPANRWLRHAPTGFLQQKYSNASAHLKNHRHLRKAWRAILILILTLWDALYLVANSMLWEILWLVAALAWGTLRVVGLRKLSHMPSEDSWGFGQILAVLLSAVPIWSFFSVLQEAKYDHAATNIIMGKENTESEAIGLLQSIEQTTWFRGLIGIIFGFSVQFAAEVLYRFPAPAVSDSVFDLSGPELLQSDASLIVAYYLVMFAFIIAFLIVFTSICLFVHLQKPKPKLLSHHSPTLSSISTGRAKSRLTIFLVLLLSALYALFNYAMFHGPPGQPSIFLRWWSYSHES